MARTRPLALVSKSRVSKSLRPNQGRFKEAVLSIHGKQLSESEQ